MAERVQIGDVVEFVTPRGLTYAQLSHRNALCGDLLRILPGFHNVRPSDFADIVNQQEAFVAFLPLQVAVARGTASIVTHEDIPEAARSFPLFRARGAIEPDTGRVLEWWLWDGEKEWRIGPLEPHQRNLPIRSIWNEALLIERLMEEWTPDQEDRIATKHREHTLEHVATIPTSNLTHFLYFQSEADAQYVGGYLQSSGYPSEVRPAMNEAEWLVLVTDQQTQTAEDIVALRSRLEAIAASRGGRYDGWETAVSR